MLAVVHKSTDFWCHSRAVSNALKVNPERNPCPVKKIQIVAKLDWISVFDKVEILVLKIDEQLINIGN